MGANELRDDFLKALRSIPNADKEGYLEALSKNARLLHVETPVELFLEVPKSEPLKSAKRFVRYWSNRISTFGNEAAFLPLRLWQGCMSKESIKLIRSSWVMLLPNDRESRPVAFLNFSSRDCLPSEQVTLVDRERCLFYVLQVLSSQVESRNKGCVWIILVDSSFHEANSLLLWLDRVLSSFPLHIAEIHILPIDDTADQPEFFEKFIPYTLKLLLSCKAKGFAPEEYLYVHEEHIVDSFSSSLDTRGIARENIPRIIGGFWTQQQQLAVVDRWIEAEQRFELLNTGDTREFEFPGRSETAQEVPPKAEDINSKMKKQRKRCQEAAVMVQHAYLERRNKRLQASVAMLEGLLREAERLTSGAAAMELTN